MIVSSLFVLVATAPEKALTVMMGASANGVQMCIEFLGIYAIWLGILQVLDDTKLSHKLSHLLQKPIRFVFGQTDPETEKNICLNVSSNILGLGFAAFSISSNKITLKGFSLTKFVNRPPSS